MVQAVLDGEAGPAREVTALNAGAAILAAGGVRDLATGVRPRSATIDSGAAAGVLGRLRALTAELSG